MPRLTTRIAKNYPIVEYFEDLFDSDRESVKDYLDRLERTQFKDFDKRTKRGVKGYSKMKRTGDWDTIKEAIEERCIDKAGYEFKTEPAWKDGTIWKVMRDRRGRFVKKTKIGSVGRPEPKREVRRG